MAQLSKRRGFSGKAETRNAEASGAFPRVSCKEVSLLLACVRDASPLLCKRG